MYQQVRLPDLSLVGTPGPVPANLMGLPNAVLADIPAHIDPPPPGLEGMGFWPVALSTPAFDPATQALAGTLTLGAPDPATRTVPATADLRPVTAAELAAIREAMPTISDRQCFQAIANLGKISEAEALAAVMTGDMPKLVTDGIASLPADQQFPARMMICGATLFHRAHPMVGVFGSFFGLDDAALDALWRAALLL